MLPELEPEAPGQLDDLESDPSETRNLFFKEEKKRKEMQALLETLKEGGRSAPKGRKSMGVRLRNLSLFTSLAGFEMAR